MVSIDLSKVDSSDLASELGRRRLHTKEQPSARKVQASRENLAKARQAKQDKAAAEALQALKQPD